MWQFVFSLRSATFAVMFLPETSLTLSIDKCRLGHVMYLTLFIYRYNVFIEIIKHFGNMGSSHFNS